MEKSYWRGASDVNKGRKKSDAILLATTVSFNLSIPNGVKLHPAVLRLLSSLLQVNKAKFSTIERLVAMQMIRWLFRIVPSLCR